MRRAPWVETPGAGTHSRDQTISQALIAVYLYSGLVTTQTTFKRLMIFIRENSPRVKSERQATSHSREKVQILNDRTFQLLNAVAGAFPIF